MTPNKSIPSFCFESPWLKPFSFELEYVEVTVGARRINATWRPELAQDLETYHNIDIGNELTRLLTEEMNRGITNTTLQDLMTVQPIESPQGNLFYFDYNYGPMEEPIVYDDGSWSMDNTFEGVIGIKSEIKQHTLI